MRCVDEQILTRKEVYAGAYLLERYGEGGDMRQDLPSRQRNDHQILFIPKMDS